MIVQLVLCQLVTRHSILTLTQISKWPHPYTSKASSTSKSHIKKASPEYVSITSSALYAHLSSLVKPHVLDTLREFFVDVSMKLYPSLKFRNDYNFATL